MTKQPANKLSTPSETDPSQTRLGTSTRAAMAFAIARTNVCVGFVVCVSVWAMGLYRIDCGQPYAAKHIHAIGDQFHVRGVDAVADPAQVVCDEFGRYLSKGYFVRDSVSLTETPTQTESTITVSVDVATPCPARTKMRAGSRYGTVLIDAAPKLAVGTL